MSEWLDTAIEKASNPITVNVSGCKIGVDELDVIPLSAAEFQVIKQLPEIKKLPIGERQEMLGLRIIFEMMSKCDSTLTWGKFQKLPLNTLALLASTVTDAVGSATGGGAMGN